MNFSISSAENVTVDSSLPVTQLTSAERELLLGIRDHCLEKKEKEKFRFLLKISCKAIFVFVIQENFYPIYFGLFLGIYWLIYCIMIIVLFSNFNLSQSLRLEDILDDIPNLCYIYITAIFKCSIFSLD